MKILVITLIVLGGGGRSAPGFLLLKIKIHLSLSNAFLNLYIFQHKAFPIWQSNLETPILMVRLCPDLLEWLYFLPVAIQITDPNCFIWILLVPMSDMMQRLLDQEAKVIILFLIFNKILFCRCTLDVGVLIFETF